MPVYFCGSTYYLKTETRLILVTIYSKLEQADISAKEVRHILKEFAEQGAQP